MKKLLITSSNFLLIMIFISGTILAQNGLLGKWKTVDDETGKPKSVVEIYMKGNNMYGKIVKLFREPGEDPDPVCDKCDSDDSRYNKKLIGMEILTGLEKDSETAWENGEILDPKIGKVYDCDIELEEAGKLKVRGYIGFSLLGRTQYWYAYTE